MSKISGKPREVCTRCEGKAATRQAGYDKVCTPCFNELAKLGAEYQAKRDRVREIVGEVYWHEKTQGDEGLTINQATNKISDLLN